MSPRPQASASTSVRYLVTVPDGVVGRPSGDLCVVDVVARPDAPLAKPEVYVDGRRVEVDVVPVGGSLSVRVDGRVIDLTTDGEPTDSSADPGTDGNADRDADWNVVASGARARVHVESERAGDGVHARPARPAGPAGRADAGRGASVVKSPMPGRVVKVLCAPGDLVAAGQPLVVLEAMKMENEIRAPAGATVARVHVTVGAAVERNAAIVTFATIATFACLAAAIACLAAIALV